MIQSTYLNRLIDKYIDMSYYLKIKYNSLLKYNIDIQLIK